MQNRRLIRNIFLYGSMTVLALIYLVPYYIIVRNALMTQSEIAAFDWIFWAEQVQWKKLG